MQIILLDFDDFNTESCCDYVEIYDGSNSKAPLIRTLSGTFTTPPGGFSSSQRYMFVEFTSDSSIVRRGFSARYISEPGEATGENDCWIASGCGTNDVKLITVPLYRCN